MSVKVIRPMLTDEEREKRMQAVDAALVRAFRVMKKAEKEQRNEKAKNVCAAGNETA